MSNISINCLDPTEMKTTRAILLGIDIWIICLIICLISYTIPVLESSNTQANIVLFVIVIPLVWFASSLYYKVDTQTHGLIIGHTMLAAAIFLQTLLIIPFYIISNGGIHYGFFTTLSFWIIVFEFLLVATLYWYVRIYPQIKSSKQ